MAFRIPASSVVTVLAVLLGAWVLYVIRDIVLMVFVAFLLATLIDPLADWCEKKSIPRSLAVLAIYVVLLALLTLAVAILVPPLISEFQDLLKNIAVVWQTILAKLGAVKSILGGSAAEFDLEKSLGLLGGVSFSTITGVLGGFVSVVITLVITFYMVVEEQPLKRMLKSLVPAGFHTSLIDVMGKMQEKFGSWFRGQMVLSLIIGVMVYAGLMLVGAPYAAPLALLAALMEFIPYVGPTLAAIPAILLAVAEAPLRGALVALVYVVVQQLENNLLVPKVMQRAVDINPVVSIVALLVGARLGGIVGALLAIPIAASLGVMVQGYFEERSKLKVQS